MHVINRLSDLRALVDDWRRAGDRIAFVPTMGNLHSGHLELVRVAHRQAPRVIVSIFVNPTQFGANEDFGRYPRTLDADCTALATVPADAVFAPTVEEMYPLGQGAVRVEVPGISDILCGAHRPGHFAGVATVVTLLFNQVQPDVAVFGQKDYQQLAVIRRFTTALGFPIEIVGVPTLRDAKGLALSSRNQYLTAQEREVVAPKLYQTLQAAAEQIKQGERAFGAIEQAAKQALAHAGFKLDYFEIRAPDLSPPKADGQTFVILLAAKLGTTRLIDNLIVEIG